MSRGLRLALAGLFAIPLIVYLALAALRVGHPYELEWQEGGMLEHVRRLLNGEPIYAPPSLEFIAFPYTPLYVWSAALASLLVGQGFATLRLVSILASCACFALLWRLASRRAGDPLAGWLAAGLFAATYRFAGAWLDVARVDSLFLASTLLAIEICDARRDLRGAALGGLCFFLAFLTKQSALVPAACVLLALAWRSRRAALCFACAFGALFLLSTWILDARTDGWYRWYVFELLRQAPWSGAMAANFWLQMLTACGPALVLALAWREQSRNDDAPVLGFALAGLWLSAWISRAHVGGWDNTLLPACAATALLFGPAVARGLRRGGAWASITALGAAAQLVLLAYDPRAQLPTAADRRAGDVLVERLQRTSGSVWMPDHGYLAQRAGKPPSAHGMAVIDVLRSGDRPRAQALVDEITRALEERRFATIVLDQRWDEDLPALAKNYRRTDEHYDDAHTFLPVTGDARRPSHWFESR